MSSRLPKDYLVIAIIITVSLFAAAIFVFMDPFPGHDPSTSLIIEMEARNNPEAQAVRSVILMIGDGLGAEQRRATQYISVGRYGVLEMDSLDIEGELKTSSADNQITDSAASATAMATGIKTKNGVVGMDQNLNALVTILEKAQMMGKSVGLVTTSQLSHATPAAFAAHVENRYQMNDIADQLIQAGVDVLLGGGENDFLPDSESGCYSELGKREDARNLIDEAIAMGYSYVCDSRSLGRIDFDSTTQLLGLFADEGLDGLNSPSLVMMTDVALQVLSKDPEGFFLFIEGGQIDWSAHRNDAAATIQNTIEFDHAVKVANEYLDQSCDTLLIVTGDHETGGLAVKYPNLNIGQNGNYLKIMDGGTFDVNWSTTSHTAVNVPVTASGPFANYLEGVHENTFIHDLILAAFCYNAPNSEVSSSMAKSCVYP